MSLGTLIGDILSGNFSHALKRLEDWWVGASPAVQAFITKAMTDEGKILEGLITVAAQDVIAGGLTTNSFVAAGKDVLAKLVAQNISTFNIQYVMAALNIQVANSQPSGA